jgi:hypothetical protein
MDDAASWPSVILLPIALRGPPSIRELPSMRPMTGSHRKHDCCACDSGSSRAGNPLFWRCLRSSVASSQPLDAAAHLSSHIPRLTACPQLKNLYERFHFRLG